MPSSHRRHGQNKTVLSCLGRVGGVNRNGDKWRLSTIENFETVLSSLKMRRGLMKRILTCRQFCVHHWQDKTRLSMSLVWTWHNFHNTRTQMHRRWKAMQYRQKTSLYCSPNTIQKLSNFCIYCYRVRQKRRKFAAKIAKNTRFQISPFALPPIGHCGEKFNIDAQLHLFRYKMSSKVCAKVQALW